MIGYFERALRQKLFQFHRETERSVQGVALELEEIFTDTSANGQQKLERHVLSLIQAVRRTCSIDARSVRRRNRMV